MSAVFLDTVGLIAVWDEDDQWHDSAAHVFEDLRRDAVVAVTTSYVLAECANAASRRPYRRKVVEMWRSLESQGRILHPSVDEWRTAWSAYEEDRIGGPGVVDLLSFLAMRRFALRRAFTNDRHFATAGFETLF